MKKIIESTIIMLGMLFINATWQGTLLCLLYPQIHYLFPSAVEKGILPLELNWWSAICITWMATILFKNNTKIENKIVSKNEN